MTSPKKTATTEIPNWVIGVLLALAVFAGGYYLGTSNSGGETAVEAGSGEPNGAELDEPSEDSTTVQSAPPVVITSEAEGETVAPEISRASPKFIQYSDLPSVLVTQLPGEALDTLDLIASDGPYPFDRDGLTFENREGILPDFPPGHYEEYTVVTPGESDRGARRIVAGSDGELYYTADHYDSFREIIYED